MKKEGNTLELAVTGHAYSNDPGKDLVCCAISTLVQTLAFYLQDVGVHGEYFIEEGSSYIKADLDKATEAAAEAILFGMEQIAKQYIQYVNYRKI